MLELKNIVKTYQAGVNLVDALKDVCIKFEEKGFVSILGPSGCGKTTMLNIIGGLDRYTTGDLIINGKSTKEFKSTEWDSYRNNTIGFVFQSYNLINHLNVLENVELALTLSGMSISERKAKAKLALERVGLSDQLTKKTNQLSGGQMQRVAIARAIVNDPDIILADEPTGALDTKTSRQILDLLNEIAKDRLVIMVTHNSKLAEEYSTRLIRLLDGRVISNEEVSGKEIEEDSIAKANSKWVKSSMSYLTSLKLSLKNLFTKKARTLMVAFAGSIGIIGVALVLAISSGFTSQIETLEADTLSAYPITINQGMTMDFASLMAGKIDDGTGNLVEFPDNDKVIIYEEPMNQAIHFNQYDQEYYDYLDTMNPEWYSEISYSYDNEYNIITYNKANELFEMNSNNDTFQQLITNEAVLESAFDIIGGEMASQNSINQMVLIVDNYNRLTDNLAEALGFNAEINAEINFIDIIGKTYTFIPNNVYYIRNDNGTPDDVSDDTFEYNPNLSEMVANENAVEMEIVGIIRPKSNSVLLSSGIAYTAAFADFVRTNTSESEIAIAQQANIFTDVLTDRDLNAGSGQKTYVELMQFYALDNTPKMIYIYPVNIETKDKIIKFLDAYNADKETPEQIMYIDMASMVTESLGTLINTIKTILIAFAAISLVVSSIMIGIITYISVLERTKEIGVLRSLGARKKDISRVFNAESILIGLTAGILGILITLLLSIPINKVIETAADMKNIAALRADHALMLIAISSFLTFIAGLIPSAIAARKNPVEALRTGE